MKTETTPQNPQKVKTEIELSYSVTAFINLDDMMKEADTTYTPLDVISLHAKYDTLYLEMSDGEKLELDISCELTDMNPCLKYPSSIGVFEVEVDPANNTYSTTTLAEQEKYGYGVEFDARNQGDDQSTTGN